jgi:transcriptional regulator of NAD metabolism
MENYIRRENNMGNTNDQRILTLKKQIEEKKEKLGKSTKFVPVTNCSIELDGVRYNIQVLTKEQLIMLMVKLNSYLMSAKVLEVLDDFNISGYHVSDWISDIQAKIDVLSRKDEERKLKAMEDKLLKLLSDGKKVELEIDEIESLLKN